MSGWDTYKTLTESNVNFQKIAESENTDPDVLMNAIEKEINNVKFKES